MHPRFIIAIDGYSSCGKSTVAKALAKRLGIQYIDSGAMYRAVTLYFMQKDIPIPYPEQLHDLKFDFDRVLDAPVEAAIAIPRSVPLVITEGNYLLHNHEGWERVAPLLSHSWFVHIDDEIRQERLIKRHMSFGMSHAEAIAWTMGSDERNAIGVREDVMRADLVITLTQ